MFAAMADKMQSEELPEALSEALSDEQVEALLAPVLGGEPDMAQVSVLSTPGLLEALRRSGSVDMARALEFVVPERVTVLYPLTLWICETLLQSLPDGDTEEQRVERSRLQGRLSVC
jgi:hypothetical protein